ncbi:hypothetical protein CAOG_001310 [Capsaspora owczarzaki ATCC 30864]|uniref:Uncharacterized protein n=1 Tax=Capsaspora owczarzaki (strain ATCC 30864) TaxID=595528 RepID=A0A0D2WIX8_CAPO3|nr:hypothetical protein CAOG_001310 [Capsaspora owczarzaki ATCC 30864]
MTIRDPPVPSAASASSLASSSTSSTSSTSSSDLASASSSSSSLPSSTSSSASGMTSSPSQPQPTSASTAPATKPPSMTDSRDSGSGSGSGSGDGAQQQQQQQQSSAMRHHSQSAALSRHPQLHPTQPPPPQPPQQQQQQQPPLQQQQQQQRQHKLTAPLPGSPSPQQPSAAAWPPTTSFSVTGPVSAPAPAPGSWPAAAVAPPATTNTLAALGSGPAASGAAVADAAFIPPSADLEQQPVTSSNGLQGSAAPHTSTAYPQQMYHRLADQGAADSPMAGGGTAPIPMPVEPSSQPFEAVSADYRVLPPLMGSFSNPPPPALYLYPHPPPPPPPQGDGYGALGANPALAQPQPLPQPQQLQPQTQAQYQVQTQGYAQYPGLKPSVPQFPHPAQFRALPYELQQQPPPPPPPLQHQLQQPQPYPVFPPMPYPPQESAHVPQMQPHLHQFPGMQYASANNAAPFNYPPPSMPLPPQPPQLPPMMLPPMPQGLAAQRVPPPPQHAAMGNAQHLQSAHRDFNSSLSPMPASDPSPAITAPALAPALKAEAGVSYDGAKRRPSRSISMDEVSDSEFRQHNKRRGSLEHVTRSKRMKEEANLEEAGSRDAVQNGTHRPLTHLPPLLEQQAHRGPSPVFKGNDPARHRALRAKRKAQQKEQSDFVQSMLVTVPNIMAMLQHITTELQRLSQMVRPINNLLLHVAPLAALRGDVPEAVQHAFAAYRSAVAQQEMSSFSASSAPPSAEAPPMRTHTYNHNHHDTEDDGVDEPPSSDFES